MCFGENPLKYIVLSVSFMSHEGQGCDVHYKKGQGCAALKNVESCVCCWLQMIDFNLLSCNSIFFHLKNFITMTHSSVEWGLLK